jgi:hypothetical protein
MKKPVKSKAKRAQKVKDLPAKRVAPTRAASVKGGAFEVFARRAASVKSGAADVFVRRSTTT